jgi:pimeloyl-ACP methyl ester carboxylesterase
MSKASNCDRRRFIGTAVTAIAGAGLLASRSGEPETWSRDASSHVATTPSANDSLGPIKQTDARPLSVRYAEGGRSNGPSVILLHGASGGIDTDVARLAARGHRVIVPYVTGLDTRRGSSATMPQEPTAAPSDVMELMAALKIGKALVIGLGESARTAEVMAALWPQRLKAMVPVSGSGVVTLAATQRPLPPKEELAWWYQYYFTSDGVVNRRRLIARAMA